MPSSTRSIQDRSCSCARWLRSALAPRRPCRIGRKQQVRVRQPERLAGLQQQQHRQNQLVWLRRSPTPKTSKPFFAPPSGSWAALSDGDSIDTTILYQDVALEPSLAQTLSMTLYYVSYEPIVVPEPKPSKPILDRSRSGRKCRKTSR